MKGAGKIKKKKTLGSYPYFSVVFSMSLALFVIGLFGLLYQYSGRLGKTIRESLTVQIYLNKNLPESQQIRINRLLTSESYVVQEGGTPQVEFISEEEAAKRFLEATGEDFTEFLGDNPLRAAFNIRISADHQRVDSLQRIKTELEKVEGIHEVVFVPSLVDSINRNVARLGMLLAALFAILLTAVVILINNTMKLALFSQRFLIRSMQLVGARRSFIMAPFLRKSIVHGAMSGVFASLLVYLLSVYAAGQITELRNIQDDRELIILFLLVIAAGMVIAGISTFMAVNRFLKMSLDDLY
jgi:cell division transport system permease protein